MLGNFFDGALTEQNPHLLNKWRCKSKTGKEGLKYPFIIGGSQHYLNDLYCSQQYKINPIKNSQITKKIFF